MFGFFKMKRAAPRADLPAFEPEMHMAVLAEMALQALEVGPDDSVLEIGFAQGWALRQLVAQLKRGSIAGLETDAAAVASASAEFPRLFSHFKADFKEGVVSKIPFPDRHFTRVLALNAFGTWLSPAKALAEIHRVLNRDGRLVIGFPAAGRVKGRFYASSEVKRIFEDALFVDVKVFESPDGSEGVVVAGRRL